MSIFCYISHHFPSLVTPYLSYLDIFLTARNYAIVFNFLCIIIFLCQFNENGHHKEFKKVTFRAFALRQSSDEGLTPEVSAFKLFSVANLRYQLG